MHYNYSLYIKTFKRIVSLSRCIQNILVHTPYLNPKNQLVVVCDDPESAQWVYDNCGEQIKNGIIGVEYGGERLGSPGTWAKAIELSRKRGYDFTIVFEDDCWPYKDGWLDLVDDFFVVSKCKHPLINFCPTKPWDGVYGDEPTTIINGSGVRVDEEERIGQYLVQKSNIDSFVFTATKNSLFDGEPHIVDPWFKFYGYWHSAMTLRLMKQGKVPWRNSHIKQLEPYIFACDFLSKCLPECGMNRLEKLNWAHKQKDWAKYIQL